MSVVRTIKENCRRCYTCVRSCPAKAIKIEMGQAKVIAERCIGCGNCIKVCTQNAKEIKSHIERTLDFISSGKKTVAAIAPSYPAEFSEIKPLQITGAIKAIGFAEVYEVGFGADLVADAYKKLLEKGDNDKPYIATTCPAVVYYIEKYQPQLIDNLVPIVSPMIATAQVIKKESGENTSIVFIGPCISKKLEAEDPNLAGLVDAVLTFKELREIFKQRDIDIESFEPEEFTKPVAGIGSVFPIAQGLLKTAGINLDILDTDILATEGRARFIEAAELLLKGELNIKFMDVLFCKGCINGPGISNKISLCNRKECVSSYVKSKFQNFDKKTWDQYKEKYKTLDLSREFRNDDKRIGPPNEEDINEILRQMKKISPEDLLNCGSCGYETCKDLAVAIYKGFAEKEMCLHYLIDQLETTCSELENSNKKLFQTQEQLIQSEKLASMGQLAAGIAHEVNNPLGTVLIYSHLLLNELKENAQAKDDLEMIAREATRCKKIISGLLDFSRQSKLIIQKCNVQEIIDETIEMTAEKSPHIQFETKYESNLPLVEIDREQIKQVFINIVTNAIDAMSGGGRLFISACGINDRSKVEIKFTDTGCGIPKENLDKIFNPFFTTKQIGKGTGLGLAISYGIIKMHRGDIKVSSEIGKGTTFTIIISAQLKQPEIIESFKEAPAFK